MAMMASSTAQHTTIYIHEAKSQAGDSHPRSISLLRIMHSSFSSILETAPQSLHSSKGQAALSQEARELAFAAQAYLLAKGNIGRQLDVVTHVSLQFQLLKLPDTSNYAMMQLAANSLLVSTPSSTSWTNHYTSGWQ